MSIKMCDYISCRTNLLNWMRILKQNITENVFLKNLCTKDLLASTKIVGCLTSTTMLWLGDEVLRGQVFFSGYSKKMQTQKSSNENHSGHSHLILKLRHANGPLKQITKRSMNRVWNLKFTILCLMHHSRVLHNSHRFSLASSLSDWLPSKSWFSNLTSALLSRDWKGSLLPFNLPADLITRAAACLAKLGRGLLDHGKKISWSGDNICRSILLLFVPTINGVLALQKEMSLSCLRDSKSEGFSWVYKE